MSIEYPYIYNFCSSISLPPYVASLYTRTILYLKKDTRYSIILIENSDTKQLIEAFHNSSSHFDALVKTLGFVSERVGASWYGLGCPAYCAQPAISFPVLTALLVFLLGIFTALYVLWTFFSGGLPPVNRSSALAGYLHKRGSKTLRRDH